ncbi:polysaccharide deacetylase family protein [Aspergillus alliaceus]|uniref:polysaccharide deacetylase family protein n=1 Tax=Petromyces alliaceus TaxID=209559 RepID=UPI0012A6BB47|nr:uncharacterized protein BDW43DRAFT_307980 [Aspergillus alliaceus]KAB8236967.1 hypothetical protein BDW43DRAFT_307980 [Aspergillus alliaceus]
MHTLLYLYTPLLLSALTLSSQTTPRTPLQVTFLQPPTNTTPITIDTFAHPHRNNLGSWHGALEDLPYTQGPNYIRLAPTDPDQTYHTQLSSTTQCFNLTPYSTWYLHITFAGPPTFSISLHQHNPNCTPLSNPYPETWDSVNAAHYTLPPPAPNPHEKENEKEMKNVYIPLSHFNISQSRVLSIALGNFYPPYSAPTTVFKIELTPSPPVGLTLPDKVPNGDLRLRCTRPGSFAFGIDDGIPALADEVREILESEGVQVTFFVVGRGLRDSRTGLGAFYREMLAKGHQVGLHSDGHFKMEGMESVQAIDEDIIANLATFRSVLGIESRYFRPPYGTIGARTRERLAVHIPDPQIINWSVDIEDWMWADSDTPERQLEAFYRDVERGGNLAVLHYLGPTTVGYFREIIRFIKGKGLKIMRIDQCLKDPSAPALV